MKLLTPVQLKIELKIRCDLSVFELQIVSSGFKVNQRPSLAESSVYIKPGEHINNAQSIFDLNSA